MEQKAKKISHVDKLSVVIKALEPLEAEERKKILSAANAYLLGGACASGGSGGPGFLSGAGSGEISSKLGDILKKNDNLRPGHKAAVVAFHRMKSNRTDKLSLDELRQLYDDIGLTPPDRLDMTIRSAISDGNKLFKRMGQGFYGLTYHGQELAKRASSSS